MLTAGHAPVASGLIAGRWCIYAAATFHRYPSGSLKSPKYPPHCDAAAGLTIAPCADAALLRISSTSMADETMKWNDTPRNPDPSAGTPASWAAASRSYSASDEDPAPRSKDTKPG